MKTKNPRHPRTCPGPECGARAPLPAFIPLCRKCWRRLSETAREELYQAQRAAEKPRGVPVISPKAAQELSLY